MEIFIMLWGDFSNKQVYDIVGDYDHELWECCCLGDHDAKLVYELR